MLKRAADVLAICVAVSLPWSTSATSILIACWLVALVPTLRLNEVYRELMTPVGGLPVLLWLLALLGTFWAEVDFSAKLSGLSSFSRLLVIPLLIAQFRHSNSGHLVLIGFLISAVLLLLLSWSPMVFPPLAGIAWRNWPGVPVKDYLAVSGIFLVCAFALAYLAVVTWQRGDRASAILYAILSGLFIGNILYLESSRTTLVQIPILSLLLGFQLFGWRGVTAACALGLVLGAVFWMASDYPRMRLASIATEVKQYLAGDELTNAGVRLRLYRSSLAVIQSAPILGHGTGTIRKSLEEISSGKLEVVGAPPTNPHQQTLAVAIQLGIVGALVLWSMWIAHMLLFSARGRWEWFGLLIVSQTVLGSLFNSFLFDFTQGWIYAFGVGTLCGLLKHRSATPQ